MIRFLLLLALLAFAGPVAAQEASFDQAQKKFRETINIGISTREIAIAPDFAGTDITIFGALDNSDPYLLAIGAYDIVVTLEGPLDTVTVRKKDNVFGLWINRDSMRFLRAPESYSIASTRVVEQIAPPIELYARDIGIKHLKLIPGSQEESATVREFRDAYLRLRDETGLYEDNPGGVSFVSASLFQATIKIPAEIPNGEHTVRAYLFKSGEFVAEKELTLHVVKTGLEQAITQAAHENSWAYGAFAVMMAMVIGWLGSIAFRRD